ncbi:hypothetical protein LEMLEM_LOCUS5449, partial [Lemmus lemmus]
MLPRSALGRPWGPGGWPLAASRGLRAALGGCCNFRGPGDPQRRCKPAPSGRAPAPPCEGETHLCARGERPGGDERGLGRIDPLRPGPRGAATPSTPAASAGDAGCDLSRSEVAGVVRAPGSARLAPSLGAWRPAGTRRRRTDETVTRTASEDTRFLRAGSCELQPGNLPGIRQPDVPDRTLQPPPPSRGDGDVAELWVSPACHANIMAGVAAALMDQGVTLKMAAACGMLAPEDKRSSTSFIGAGLVYATVWPLLLSRYLVLVENKGSRAVEEKGRQEPSADV